MNAYAAWTHHDWVRHYAGDRGVGVLTTQGAFENPRLHGRVVHSFSVGPRGVAGVGAVDLGTIATTDRINSQIARIDAIWQSIANDQAACVKSGKIADDATVTAFAAQYADWKAYAASHKDLSFWQFGKGAILDQVESYEVLAYNWQQKLKDAGCNPSAPMVKPDPAKDRPIFGNESKGTLDALQGIAIAAAVAVGIWAAAPLLRGVGGAAGGVAGKAA